MTLNTNRFRIVAVLVALVIVSVTGYLAYNFIVLSPPLYDGHPLQDNYVSVRRAQGMVLLLLDVIVIGYFIGYLADRFFSRD